MTAPCQNGVFIMGPKKDAIKPVSVKSLLDEINKVRRYVRKKEQDCRYQYRFVSRQLLCRQHTPVRRCPYLNRLSKEMSFAIFCMENYKVHQNLKGKEVLNLFEEYNVFSYLIDCYDTLSTVGDRYLMADIDEYLRVRGVAL